MPIFTSTGEEYKDEFEYELAQFEHVNSEKIPIIGPESQSGDSDPSVLGIQGSLTDTSAIQENITPSGELRPLDKLLGTGGQERYQLWPERMVRSMVDAITLPGKVAAGEIDPLSELGIQKSIDLAGLVVLGPAPIARSVVDGTLGVMAGVRSKTINKENLALAKQMEEKGMDRDQIYDATGFFRGLGQLWRYEISDTSASLTSNAWKADRPVPLDRVLNHPELFKAYPELKNIKYKIDDEIEYMASFSGGDTIVVNTKKIVERGYDIKEVIMHEAQHAIQKTEGFFRGSSPAISSAQIEAAIQKRANEVNKKDPEAVAVINQIWNDYNKKKNDPVQNLGWQAYMRNPGEIEARMVQRRSTKKSSEKYPYKDNDFWDKPFLVDPNLLPKHLSDY